jgi:hypothetical protein
MMSRQPSRVVASVIEVYRIKARNTTSPRNAALLPIGDH